MTQSSRRSRGKNNNNLVHLNDIKLESTRTTLGLPLSLACDKYKPSLDILLSIQER